MSFASCRECLSNVAEPEFCFHYLYDCVSHDGEGLADFVNELSTFKDGVYMTWTEWKAWRQDPSRKAELDAKWKQQEEEMNDAEQAELQTDEAYNDEEHWPGTPAREVREEDLPDDGQT